MRILETIAVSVLFSMLSAAAFADDTIPLTNVVTNDEGETLLADSFNRTLYVFDADKDKPMPTCEGVCAEVWPPYLVTDDEVKGLAAPLGSVDRSSKMHQLTYDGRPVYTYAYDRTNGDDKGDGIGNVWHYIGVTPEQPPAH